MLPDRERADRQARRALYRAHHPDHGGDPTELLRRLGELDAAKAVVPAPQDVVFVRRRRVDRLRAWAERRHRPARVV
jgi:hypothetical protein